MKKLIYTIICFAVTVQLSFAQRSQPAYNFPYPQQTADDSALFNSGFDTTFLSVCIDPNTLGGYSGIYASPDSGWVTGTNSKHETEKLEQYNFHGHQLIKAVAVLFYSITSGNSGNEDSVAAVIHKSDGTVIGTSTPIDLNTLSNFSYLTNGGQNFNVSFVVFSFDAPIPVYGATNDMLVGITMPTGTYDTLVVASSPVPCDSAAGLAWDKEADGTYHTTLSDWGRKLDYLIFPIYDWDPNLSGISETHNNPTCGNSNGSINITISGGTPPFTYAWSNGATTQNLSSIAAGSYSLTVTDSTGAVNSITIPLSNINGPVISAIQTNETGLNDSIAGIFISVSGGTSPYTFDWSNGEATDSIFKLVPGTYNLTVSDAGGCVVLQSYTVYPFYYIPFYVFVSDNQPNCSNNGSESAIAYGGTPPYHYLWSTGDTTQNLTGLDPGSYVVTVTDTNGQKGIGYDSLQSYCYNVIQGRVFNDANNNCIFDAGDAPEAWECVTATSGNNQYYGYTGYDGTFSIAIPTSGAFQISVYYGGACGNTALCGNSSNTVTFGSVGDTATVNLGFVGSSGYDLTIHPGWTSAKPGFQKEYWVMPYNQAATNDFTGTATVVFKYDSALVYQNSYDPQPVHDPVAHTLTWTVNNVPYPNYDWYNVRFENFFMVPASLPLGYQLQSSFYITPTSGDCDSSNNLLTFSEDVTGSHDPNRKEVSPAGDISPGDSVLTYTIDFQNDGTDTTSFIIVRDTLSPNLNPASVQTVASSHPYSQFYVSGKGVLTWVFNPILLVDSATNLAGSKGFVSFRIKKKAGLPLNTVISNKASIFFDYNSGVVTNTVTNTITTGIKTIAGNSGVSVNVYPNPFSENSTFEVTGIQGVYSFTLNNVLGQQVQQLNGINSNKFDINRSNLNAGIYFYSIVVGGKTVANGKVVVQ